ncbi:MAG: FAD-dependent oxidoreductase [Spirochaetaceae bacterium]|jgi:thioredoxin reductase (NADPH)|nr:FAD-dependent oxidoreductase [Spirochaetaceae bacterium]
MFQSDTELLILGAGPAGLTAAQYGARANLKVLVVEQLAPGGQALLIDRLENYPGNVPGAGGEVKSGFDFAQDLRRQAEAFGAQCMIEAVVSLQKEGTRFRAVLGNGKTLSAPAVIIATGAKHRTLDIPGEEQFSGRGVSYCASCDGPFFKGKKILVVGGGDAACDEAQYLSRLSETIILIHRRDRFRAQKALAERTLNNPHIAVRFNTRVREIRGTTRVASAVLERTDTGETYEEEIGAVFVFAGTIPQSAFVSGVRTDENGYIITDQTMAASLPGLFAAGDVRASPFRQVVIAAGEGAVAAHSAAAYIDALKGEIYR